VTPLRFSFVQKLFFFLTKVS